VNSRGRTWVLLLSGPTVWFVMFASSYALTTQGCSVEQRAWVLGLNGAALLVCVIAAVLVARQTSAAKRRAESAQTSEALNAESSHFLLTSSLALQTFCALLVIAQMIPLFMHVSCDG
jgi:hypothetical protein